jgi:glutamate--cysteine ligase
VSPLFDGYGVGVNDLNTVLKANLALLSKPAHGRLLSQGLRGVERETLRVKPDGQLAVTPHPQDRRA